MTPAIANKSVVPGLHVRYEKAGLIFDALPIPWNADAVIVEANVRVPSSAPSLSSLPPSRVVGLSLRRQHLSPRH